MSLNFVNKTQTWPLNSFSTSNFEMDENKDIYIKLPTSVSLAVFVWLQGFPFQNCILPEIKCVNQVIF